MKILVIGQNFYDGTGGGVTIRNLFSQFDKDEIYLATTSDLFNIDDLKKSKSVYLLGDKEYKVKFPFSLLQKSTKSKIINKINDNQNNIKLNKNKNIQRIFNQLLDFLRYLGAYNYIRDMKLSSDFLHWYDDVHPDVVYTQLGSLYMVNFINRLLEKRSFKLVVHIMDDWPNSLKGGMVYKGMIYNSIDAKFKRILLKTDLKLCISDLMVEEYRKRYNGNWFAFHNCVSNEFFNDKLKKGKNKEFNILYFGRIGIANKKSLNKFIRIVETYYDNIRFSIYSPDYAFFKKKQYKNTIINNSVSHEKVLDLMVDSDLLFLPLDFNSQSRTFVQLSMPTKMPEYMASGTPIFILAPEECALSKYAKENNIGVVCNSDDVRLIKQKLDFVMLNYKSITDISMKAKELSFANHNIETQATKFKIMINNMLI